VAAEIFPVVKWGLTQVQMMVTSAMKRETEFA
jgi:hypothetical protein